MPKCTVFACIVLAMMVWHDLSHTETRRVSSRTLLLTSRRGRGEAQSQGALTAEYVYYQHTSSVSRTVFLFNIKSIGISVCSETV